MKMNDVVIVSVDDHVCEPPNMFDNQLSGELLASAPKNLTDKNGCNYWSYQGTDRPLIGLNAWWAAPTKSTAWSRILSASCARVATTFTPASTIWMSTVSLPPCASATPSASTARPTTRRRTLALRHMQAWNDWHYEEWCLAYPGRFVPLCILPTWDVAATVAEINRCAKKGFRTVSMNENPTMQGLPSIHNDYRAPVYKAIVDNDMTIAQHIGTGNPAPHASMEIPIESTMPMSVAQGVADWLQLEELHKYPNMRIAVSEGNIGWVPYLMERSDFANERHKSWTHSRFQDIKPRELMKRHFMHCFLYDPYGVKNLDQVGEDNVAYEVDHPHSDAVWPDAPEDLWKQCQHLTDEQIDKITPKNAIRWFQHESLFEHFKRDDITVGALRAKAAAKGVDTTLKPSGGARPTDEARPVTSGDIIAMSKKAAEERAA